MPVKLTPRTKYAVLFTITITSNVCGLCSGLCYSGIAGCQSKLRLYVRQSIVNLFLGLFGDDAETTKTKKCRVLSWCPTESDIDIVAATKVPAYMIDFGSIVSFSETEYPLMEAIRWSFEICLSGVMPASDHLGRPFATQSLRGRVAGRKIADGIRLVFVKIGSDWKYSREVFEWQQAWDQEAMCHKCCATKTGERAWTRFERQPVRDNDLYMATARCPLALLPGFHLSCVISEAMHGGPLGSLCQAAGSCLYDLLLEGRFDRGGDPIRGPWKPRTNVKLETAYNDFQAWMKTTVHHKSSCSKFSTLANRFTDGNHLPNL